MKNKVLYALVGIDVAVLSLAACAIDSDSRVPLVVIGTTVTLLGLFCRANGWIREWFSDAMFVQKRGGIR